MINIKNFTKLNMLIVVLLAAGFYSCNNSLYDLAAKREVPFADVVVTKNINDGIALSLSWKKDKGADAYVLMRSEEGKTGYGDFIEVYWGTKTEYMDFSIKKDTSYMYRLDKERGNKVFKGIDIVLFDQSPEDPEPGVITTMSLNEGRSVYLLWEADEWAELYVIMKTEIRKEGIDFGNPLVTEKIEIPKKTNCVDNNIDPEKSYAYRLDKKRGDEIQEGLEITVFEKTLSDPFLGIISARSMNNGNAVYLTWEADEWAEHYVIMKKEISSESNIDFDDDDVLETISGKTSYIDNNIDPGKSYAYRLDKKRENKIQEGEEITIFEKTLSDPFLGKISARSMNNGNAVYLTWEADEWAEQYVIMKKEISSGSGIIFEDDDVLETISGKTSYIDNNIDPGKNYAYRLDKKRGNKIQEGEEITVFKKTLSDPFLGIITAMSMNNGNAVYLAWEADEWADQYLIMKKEISSGSGIIFEDDDVLKTISGKTSYIDNSIDPGKSYAYRLDKKRRDEPIIEGSEITMYERSRFDPFPDAVVIESINNGMALSLSWRKDSGADTYIVMRSEEGNSGYGEFKEAYRGEQPVYIDRSIKKDTSYIYRLDKEWNKKKFSGLEITTFGKTIPDPIPGIISAMRRDAGSSAYLTWETDEWTESYVVVRTEVTKAGIDFDNAEVSKRSDEIIGKIDYVDSGLDPWKSYAYRLDKRRGEAEMPGEKTTVLEQFLPNPFPGTISAASLNDGWSVSLTWEADAWAEQYVIMKTETASESNIIFDDDDVLETISGKTSYVDNDIDTEKSYAYRLDKKRGNEPVIEGSITIFKRTRPDPSPGKITAQSISNGKRAYLTWEEDAGADEYRIMRSLNDESVVFFNQLKDGQNGFYMEGKTSAWDTQLEDDKSYLYRLDTKRRDDTGWTYGDVTVFSRTRPLPYGEAPKADGFRTDGIMLKWSADEGADSYMVMRRKEPVQNNIGDAAFKLVAEIDAPGTSYLDEEVRSDPGRLYEYRLKKIRNGEPYDYWPHMTTRMVAAGVEEDEYDSNGKSNDTEEQATLLDGPREANLYLYQYNDGPNIADDDWYKVYLPARHSAHIRVVYENGSSDDGYLQLYEKWKPVEYITHSTEFLIKNTANYPQYVAFAIQPNSYKFLEAGAKGGIVAYSIESFSTSSN